MPGNRRSRSSTAASMSSCRRRIAAMRSRHARAPGTARWRAAPFACGARQSVGPPSPSGGAGTSGTSDTAASEVSGSSEVRLRCRHRCRPSKRALAHRKYPACQAARPRRVRPLKPDRARQPPFERSAHHVLSELSRFSPGRGRAALVELGGRPRQGGALLGVGCELERPLVGGARAGAAVESSEEVGSRGVVIRVVAERRLERA